MAKTQGAVKAWVLLSLCVCTRFVGVVSKSGGWVRIELQVCTHLGWWVSTHHSSNAYAQVTELASKLFFMISSFLLPFLATSVLTLAYFNLQRLNKQIKASSGTGNR
ncbi:hypothetical protein PIB30_075273 [Stylosanthes scabra]|uniref:Uncharacterized protein n=1 Tax=Stylosanthes scabra TaxID=79078 RepID=A0ABU6WPR3_9FABA|nr:hypothetical protein [Stylosanthes scabra]